MIHHQLSIIHHVIPSGPEGHGVITADAKRSRETIPKFEIRNSKSASSAPLSSHMNTPTNPMHQQLNPQGLPANYPFRPDWEVTPREVAQALQSDAPPRLIDCRTPKEWALVKIDGAELVPLQQWSAHLESLESSKDQPVIVYCHHGGRSLQLTMLLRQQGFTSVKSLAGGIDLWAIDIAPGMIRY